MRGVSGKKTGSSLSSQNEAGGGTGMKAGHGVFKPTCRQQPARAYPDSAVVDAAVVVGRIWLRRALYPTGEHGAGAFAGTANPEGVGRSPRT